MMPRIWSLFQMSCSVPVPHVWANAGTWAVLWHLGMFCCLQHRAYLWSKVFCGHSTLLKSHLEENHPPGMLKIITAVFGLPPESQSTGTYKIKFGSLYFSGRARWRALLRVGSWPFSLLWPWLVLAGTRVFNREQPSPRCWPGFFTKGQAGSRTSCSCSSFSQVWVWQLRSICVLHALWTTSVVLSPAFKTPKEIFSRQGHFSPPVSDQGARRLCGRTDDARAEYSGWEQAGHGEEQGCSHLAWWWQVGSQMCAVILQGSWDQPGDFNSHGTDVQLVSINRKNPEDLFASYWVQHSSGLVSQSWLRSY